VNECPRCGYRKHFDPVRDEVERIRAWAEENRIRTTLGGRLRQVDAASYFDASVRTLRAWAHEGRGPKVTRVMGSPYYDVEDLARWIVSGE